MSEKNSFKEPHMITVHTVGEWRSWLEKNYLKEKKVGMISYKKHTGKHSISHREAMHEAICFGWIDTTIKRLDEERFVRYFMRRGEKANWSKNTLSYAKALLEAGKMTETGIARYNEGLLKKPLNYDIPDNPSMPRELKEKLLKNDKARKNFEAFSPSVKRIFYRWILRAKGEETKNNRVKTVVEKAERNEKLFG